MSPPSARQGDPWSEVAIDLDLALAEAQRRVRSLPEIAKTLARADQDALETCLSEALALVREHARPMGIFTACAAETARGVLRLGRARIRCSTLRGAVRPGDRVIAYLASLGYTNQKMFEAAGRDYVGYHFQHYVSRELLFVSARQVGLAIRRAEGAGLRSFAVLEERQKGEAEGAGEGAESEKLYWDERAIADLFALFEHNPLGVRLTASRTLNPIYSLLGVMIPQSPGKVTSGSAA